MRVWEGPEFNVLLALSSRCWCLCPRLAACCPGRLLLPEACCVASTRLLVLPCVPHFFPSLDLLLTCRYEREGRPRKTIKAQQLWFAILEAQVGACRETLEGRR